MPLRTFCAAAILMFATPAFCNEGDPIFVWPGLAPMETSDSVGTLQPSRETETVPVQRVTHVRRPSMQVLLAEKPNGTAMLVLPGGGFAKVVPNKEGTEAAEWLNSLGISIFVLNYRTNEETPAEEPAYVRPLQDAQRALRLIRSRAAEWKIAPEKVGVLAFSAGGQVGAILHTATQPAYESVDEVDEHEWRPDFSMLIYPWRVLDESGKLLPAIQVTKDSPPAFLVHTHDDRSSSVGSALIYAALRNAGASAELHVYQNGGHGYGMRAVRDSDVGTWPDRGGDWLVRRGLGTR